MNYFTGSHLISIMVATNQHSSWNLFGISSSCVCRKDMWKEAMLVVLATTLGTVTVTDPVLTMCYPQERYAR